MCFDQILLLLNAHAADFLLTCAEISLGWLSLLVTCRQDVQVKLKGSGDLLTASAQHSSEATVAKQQAALDLIHQLQHAVVAMLTASQPEKAPVATTATHNSSGNNAASPVMKTLHQGDLENSMPEIGNVVKVQYQLVLDAQTGQTSQDLNNPARDADGVPSIEPMLWTSIASPSAFIAAELSFAPDAMSCSKCMLYI